MLPCGHALVEQPLSLQLTPQMEHLASIWLQACNVSLEVARLSVLSELLGRQSLALVSTMLKRLLFTAMWLMISAASFSQVGGPGTVVVGGGGSGGGTGDVLLAGDADGQTIQGRSGSDEARVDIGEGHPYEARMIGGGATPAFAFVDNAYFYAQSPDTNSSIQVTDGSVQISSDAAVGLSVVPTGAYFGASATSFYAGSPDSTNTIDVSNAAVRILYSQTPPTNSNDTCTAGDTIDTATFHYYCHTNNAWVRVAMATW